MIHVEKKILRIVRETIAAHKMFSRGDAVLVAVSGGPDSIALVHVLLTLAGEYSLRLAIAHLNHCLRGSESEHDAEFVTATAGRLDLPIYTEKKDVLEFQQSRRLSLEEAARMVRYHFYKAAAAKNGFDKIALGHHSDDNAELVLMNLLRGSGPLGLSGIAPVREGKIVRPLIQLRRSEINDYLTEKKLPYITDSSNSDLAFIRNKIRHHLIPELQTNYNLKITETLNRLGEILRAENQWFDNVLDPIFEQCVSSRADQTISLDLSTLTSLAKAIQRRVIRRAISGVKNDLRRISLSHIDATLRLVEKGRATGRLNLPDGILVIKNTGELTISKGLKERKSQNCSILQKIPKDYQYVIAAQETRLIREGGVSIALCEINVDELPDLKQTAANSAFFDLDRLSFPLLVRNPRPGDRFSPLGVNGTQKLKKFFIDHKISLEQRQKCPLLLSEGNIIWIAGHRIDNAVKVSARTRRVLKAELLLA